MVAIALFACSRPQDLADYCALDGITCDTFDVPSDWSDPDSDPITLQYSVQSADDPDGSAFTMLNGGPSSSSLEAFGMMMEGRLGRAVRRHHDVVLVDQRGIPFSSPSLDCPELDPLYRELLPQDLPFADREAARIDALVACEARLAGEGIDLADYTSVQAAQDLAAVMEHLGYDQYAVWGVSYGTILAQHVLRADPDHVSALVLDSTAPLDVNILQESPRSASLAWDAIDAACRADDGCTKRYPDVKGTLQASIAALDANPVRLGSTSPFDGSTYTWTLDGDGLVYAAAAAPLTTTPAYLPWYTYEIADGDTSSLAQGGVADLAYSPTSIDLWTYTFRCSEQADLDAAAPPDPETWPEFDHAFRPVLTAVLPACEALGLEALPAEIHEPVASDVPALMFSGAMDPVTPPWMAEHLAETLPNATIVHMPLTGHIASLSPCAFDAIGAFLDDPATAPDTTCTADFDRVRKTGCATSPGGGVWPALFALLVACRQTGRRFRPSIKTVGSREPTAGRGVHVR